MNAQIDRRDIEDLMVPALRQYQHNDCSGLVAGYDLEETISIIADIIKSARDNALEEAAIECETASIPFDIEVWQNNTKQGMTAKTAIALAELIRTLKNDAEHAKHGEPTSSTPSATWRKNGEPDPHGSAYDCERAGLMMGHLTDDELANAAFMNYDVRPAMQDIIDGKAHSPIAYMTAVKDRIRWLSRKLEQAAKHNQEHQEKLTKDQLKQTRGYQNADYNGINAIIWFKRGFEQAEKSYGIGGAK